MRYWQPLSLSLSLSPKGEPGMSVSHIRRLLPTLPMCSSLRLRVSWPATALPVFHDNRLYLFYSVFIFICIAKVTAGVVGRFFFDRLSLTLGPSHFSAQTVCITQFRPPQTTSTNPQNNSSCCRGYSQTPLPVLESTPSPSRHLQLSLFPRCFLANRFSI